MRTHRPALLAACLALSACGGGGGGGGAAPPACVAGTACTPSSACSLGELRCEASGPTCVATTSRPDGAACGEGATCSGGACLRTITVTGVDRYVDDAGNVVTVPQAALDESTFRALVLAADGSYQAFPGSHTAPGVVELPGVPVGPCLVERTHPVFTVPEYTEVSGNVLDDSYDLLGRPGDSSTQATRVELLATGLAPWQASTYPDDRFQIVSTNLGWAQDLWDPAIPDGATEGSLLPWEGWTGVPLFDGAAGDRVQVVQLGRFDGPVPYLAAVRSGTLPATFTVEDGVGQVVPVALGPIERTGALEADWAFGEMEALLGEMGPSPAEYRTHRLAVLAVHPMLGWPGPIAPTLLEAYVGALSGTLTLGPLAYGRPYPDFLEDGVEASMTATMKVPLQWLPSLSVDATVHAWLGTPAQGRLTARPAVSPPRDVRVAGLDVGGLPRENVGTSPIISWSPPRLGSATLYRVTLHQVLDVDRTRTVARFLTPSSELRIPAGLLSPGAIYYARLTAYSDTGYAQTVTSSFVP